MCYKSEIEFELPFIAHDLAYQFQTICFSEKNVIEQKPNVGHMYV